MSRFWLEIPWLGGKYRQGVESGGCEQARVFQNSRCALSGSALELPAVHFMCGHSFNARALGDNERECPLCAPQFRTILDIRRSLRAGASEQASIPFD